MLARRCLFALLVALTTFTFGCGDTKPEPKAPAGVDLKPLDNPKSPADGGGSKTPKAAPGGGAGSQ